MLPQRLVGGLDFYVPFRGVLMSNDLLQRLKFGDGFKKNAVPLAMEFPVDPVGAPYLVSSTTSLLWIGEPVRSNFVRAAIRRDVKEDSSFFLEVLEEVANTGMEAKWGNVHPLTKEGVIAAVEHVQSYGMEDVEILSPPSDSDSLFPKDTEFNGIPIRRSVWVPDDYRVVVPTDRDFVGFIGRIGSSSIVSVIHNPSRGMGIAKK